MTARMPPSQRQFTIEALLFLPLLWGFVALVLAAIIPPAHLSHQLAPIAQHHNPLEGPAASALILTAHPDDESMFFAPTIRALLKGGWDVRGLCLSNGNAEGMGRRREEELRDAYEVLGVEGDKVEVLNLPELQDGMNVHWDTAVIQKVVDDYLAKHPAEIIITFDPHGISAHPNHRSLSTYRPPTLSLTRLYHLRTPLSVLTKYSGPLNPLFRRAWYQLSVGLSEWAEVFDMPQSVGDDVTLINSGLDWVRSVRAMLRHKSQMRWFRYGWVAGSGVMWANDLRFVA